MLRSIRHIALLSLACTVACGGDSSGPADRADVAGVWNASGSTSTGNAFLLILTLQQTEGTASGTGTVVGAATGTVGAGFLVQALRGAIS